MRIRISLLLLLSFLSHAMAQKDIVHFDNIGRVDGLAQSTISGIVQGKDGFMWFATAEGLHRYDGYDLKIYKHDIGDTSSLSYNHITSIYEDHQGYIWVGTYTGQLDRFDKRTQLFKHYPFKDRDKNINQYQINCIREDENRNILIGTDGGGMTVFHRKENIWENFTEQNSILPSNYVKSFSPEVNQLGLWIGTLQGIVLYHQNKFKTFRSLEAFSNQSVNDILHHGSKLYVVTNGQGLQIWDTKTDKVVPIPSPRIRKANFTTFVTMDGVGNLWIGTDGAGLLKFTGDRYVTYHHNPYNYQSIVGNDIYVGYQDTEGALWFGGRVGVSKYDPKLKVFNLFNTFEKDGKPTNKNLYAIYETRDSMIWIGTLGGGIASFNPASEKLQIYGIVKDGDVETKSIRSFYEDKEGVLWIGTRDEGLFSMDRKTNTFTHYPVQTLEINNKAISHIMEDSDGTLWLATRWGLASFDRDSLKYTVYQTGFLTNNPIYQILEDKKRNELILVTFRTGLHIFNKKNRQSELVLQHDKTDSNSPSANSMMCIEQMNADSFLIGTYSGGLNIFDRQKMKFTAITSKHGLPNDVIYGILKSDDNTYWLSSNNGLIEYKWRTNKFKSYDLSHYLQDLEYNEGAYVKAKDGTLYFGGQKGFNYFRPNEIKVGSSPPRVVFTSFKTANQEVRLDIDINYQKELRISYDENLISFSFSALSYSNTGDNRYQYKLEGFDSDWINAGTRREAFYTHLSPGTYEFKVRASNYLGTWSDKDKSVMIIVDPPYWQTWWFRTLIGLLILAIIGLVFRLRTRSISKSYKHKLVDLELKALRSQMNPHFIFNSLNSIQYFVLKNEPKEAYNYLTKFSSLMRMILQNSSVKYITLQEEYDWLYTYLDLEKLRMENLLDYSIQVDEKLNPEGLYVPSMLIQPYVENAIVHGLLPKTEDRKLSIRFDKHRDQLKCVIEDNGIGRVKSVELNANRTKKHKSQGIKVTGERLEVITRDLQETPEFFILDLFDDNHKPIGTRVTIFLPIITKIKEDNA
ncbi:MAG: ligand-binding sensor domain-containing protein [Bacteroidia bacterium]|jgi:ligand-binding sensor domain-containing protein